MRLFIAEKPSMGMEIAKVLSNKNNKSLERSDGFISVGNDVVTWQFGHILELKSASELDPQYEKWSFDTLPIIPQNWQRKIKDDCVKQFNVIKKLIENTDEIIHAGDPDREGELLIRETLIHLNNTKPVKRILLNALDEKSILYALDNLKDDSVFDNLYISAEARTRADWLIGINLTRAYTLIGKDNGLTTSINIGRVMTPTFSLVVQRENEIRQFNATKYYSLTAIFKSNQDEIQTKLKVPDEIKENDYVIDKTLIEDIENKLKKNPLAIISDYTVEKKTEYPLLPYSLSELQLVAGKKYNYEPKLVLDTVQSLYEKKLTTYPRSDCSYLPENQFDNATEILNTLSNIDDNFKTLIQEANPKLKSKAWNDKKITAHHAIIPTAKSCDINNLSETEKNIYKLISTCYIAQFYPAHIYNKTDIKINCNDYIFTATGKTILDLGWKKLYKANHNDEENILPICHKGDKVIFINSNITEGITKPPKRFTPATLLEAMKKIDKFVKSPEVKAILKNISGIGTEATRASIIEKLLDKNFIAKDKQNLIPTKYGESIYKVLPRFLKTPDITAVWENELGKIAEGTGDVQKFLSGQIKIINEAIKQTKSLKLDIDISKSRCPYCHSILRPVISKKTNLKYWICKNFSTAEDSKCKKGIFSDKDDKPVLIHCNKCRKGYMKKNISKDNKIFWGCDNYPKCKNIMSDKNGLPNNSTNTKRKKLFK